MNTRPSGTIPVAPLDSDERLHVLDILRGLALFGMILVHFHQKMRRPAGGVEDLISWGVWIFVEQKAWGTFAFLFGVGFAILLRRLEARHAPVAAIYVRRLVALAVFGLIAEIGFGFHILFEYACWGMALLLVRRWPTPALLAAAIAAVCARPVVWLLAPAARDPSTLALLHSVDVAAGSAGYAGLFHARWAEFWGTFLDSWRNLLPDTNVALFIVGLLAVRHRVVDEPLRHRRLIVRWMAFGTASWAIVWVLPRLLPRVAASDVGAAALSGFGVLQDQWLCFGYVGAMMLLLARRPAWVRRLMGVGLAGRMALTNYLLQAAALDAMASHYGWAIRLRPYAYVPAAVALFGVEVLFSRLWLAWYRFGPLEWIWRTVTYLRRQPLRRPRAMATVVAEARGDAA